MYCPREDFWGNTQEHLSRSPGQTYPLLPGSGGNEYSRGIQVGHFSTVKPMNWCYNVYIIPIDVDTVSLVF